MLPLNFPQALKDAQLQISIREVYSGESLGAGICVCLGALLDIITPFEKLIMTLS